MIVDKHNNSVIFKDTIHDNNFVDFSVIGIVDTSKETEWTISLTANLHSLTIGDAVYYNLYGNRYERALANNSPMQEVIGVVSNVIDENNFELTLKGDIILDRYSDIETGEYLYLSPIIPGKLIQDEPDTVSKIIAQKTEDGINVNIQRGYYLKENETDGFYYPRNYTQEELTEIVAKIKRDIY